MTAALALDFSNEAMTPAALSPAYRPPAPRDPWLARRGLTWGGSEVGPLLIAYGLAPLDSTPPSWVIEQSEHYARLGIPKLIAWKSGLRARPKGDQKSKDVGNDRERELLARYRSTIAKHRVDPRSIRHADTVPKQFFPLVDRECFRLAVTPDAWARAHDGELTMIELKCTFKPLQIVRAPWHYRCQLQAEMATCAAAYGLLVMGEQWIHMDIPGAPPPADGPVRAFAFRRDEPLIDLIRTVVTEAWGVVEALRNLALELDALGDSQRKAVRDQRKTLTARCAETWTESRARMQVHADPARALLDEALAGIEGIDALTDFAV